MNRKVRDIPELDSLLVATDLEVAAENIITLLQNLQAPTLLVFPVYDIFWANQAYWNLLGIYYEGSGYVNIGDTGWLTELSPGGWMHDFAGRKGEKSKKGFSDIVLPVEKKLKLEADMRYYCRNADGTCCYVCNISNRLSAFDNTGLNSSGVSTFDYELVFRQMVEGGALCEIISDRSGKAVDFQILAVNPAFETITGLYASEITGKTGREVFPDLESFWAESYGKVTSSGNSTCFTHYSQELNKYLKVKSYQAGSGYFVSLFEDVTPQVESELKLKGKNEEWINTFDAVPEMVAILDNECNIVHCNSALADTFDVKRDELIGRKCYEIFHGACEMIDQCPHRELLKDGQKHEASFFNKHLGLSLEVGVSPVQNSEGNVVGSVHVARDVTEKKRIEDSLRESERKYRVLFENMNVGFVLLEAVPDKDDDQKIDNFVFLEINPAAESIIRSSVTTLVGQRLKDVYPAIWNEWYVAAEHVLRSGIPRMIDYCMEESDRYFQVWLFAADSRRLAVLFSDVSTGVHVNEQLRLKSAAIEASFNGIAISDIEGRLIYANVAFLNIWGFPTLNDAIAAGKLPFLDSPEASGALERTVDAGVWNCSSLLSRRLATSAIEPGEDIIANINMSLIEKSNHTNRYIITVVLDVTRQKKIEREALHRRDQLIHADKLATVGTLVACIMHEINNPVGVISLNTPILQSVWQSLQPYLDDISKENPDLRLAGTPYEKLKGYIPQLLDGIMDASERITRIIRRLKNFSRPENNEDRGEIDINRVVKNSANFLENHIHKYTRNFSMELAEDLVSIPEGYPHSIEQVVVNVIMNACQSLADTNKAVTIRTSYDTGNDHLVVVVQDEGCGIDSGNIENLTTPFFTTKSDRGGSGLGLSVCNSILKEHGGWLEFDSIKGSGTTVKIVLPVK